MGRVEVSEQRCFSDFCLGLADVRRQRKDQAPVEFLPAFIAHIGVGAGFQQFEETRLRRGGEAVGMLDQDRRFGVALEIADPPLASL